MKESLAPAQKLIPILPTPKASLNLEGSALKPYSMHGPWEFH